MMINPALLVDDRVEELPIEFESYEEELRFRNQLLLWTQEYGSIYLVVVNDIVFIYRTLRRSEWKMAKDIFDDVYEQAEFIVQQCVLEPIVEDYSSDIFAGIPESLCSNILADSGYADPTKLEIQIAKWEKEMENIVNQIPIVIKEAFQDIPLAEIEAWPNEKLSEYFVKAKWLLKTLRGIELTNGEEEPNIVGQDRFILPIAEQGIAY